MSRHPLVDRLSAPAPGTGRTGQDSGAVALLVALMIPMLLIFVAVAVDISRWYVELQRMQSAADAAALAAAPYMPESLAAGGPASRAALKAIERNGYPASQATVTSVPGSATQVSVTVSGSVRNVFAPIIGIPTTDLSRTGVADFAPPISLGNPSAGRYWVNIAGSSPPDSPGYVFKVRANASGILNLEGYDIGWVATGDHCDDSTALVGTNVTNNFVQNEDEAAQRYARGDNDFCTGDTQMAGVQGDSSKIETVVTVRAPAANPYEPLMGSVICTMRLPGWDLSTPVAELDDDGEDNELARTYHRWSNLLEGCASPFVTAGQEYSIQVETIGPGGQNRYGLRATVGGSEAGASIFAVGQRSIYTAAAGSSYFNLVRLDNSAKNHVLSVRFYSDQPVGATVLQPDDSTSVETPFDNCAAKGPVAGPLTGCTVPATAAVNGDWQTIRIPITDAYECSDDNDQAKCWVRIRLNPTAVPVTTTWAVELMGDPVRLVR